MVTCYYSLSDHGLSSPSTHRLLVKRLQIAHIVELLLAWLVKTKGLTALSYNAFVPPALWNMVANIDWTMHLIMHVYLVDLCIFF